jgi:hypothetical protein
MMRTPKIVVGALLALATFASTTWADPTVTIRVDSGTRTDTTIGPPHSVTVTTLPTIYGSGGMTITAVASGWKLTFFPSAGFAASANNLSGAKTSFLAGLLAFDIDFGAPIDMTANIFENGTYLETGTGRVDVAAFDVPSGVMITQLDGGASEQHGNSYVTSAIVNFLPDNTWTLFDQVTDFSKPYQKYRVVIDNDLLAEAISGPASSATIAKTGFSIIFTTDGSNGGGPIPEPASLGMLALGGAALLIRRRR